MRTLALAVLLAAALTLAACGGGSETTTVITGAEDEATTEATATTATTPTTTTTTATPTVEADKAAIESLMLGFAATVGAEACEFYSVDYLAKFGSLQKCERESADVTEATFAVDDVTVEGDTGTATVRRTDPEGKKNPVTYPVVRDGDSTDTFAGWRIDGDYTD